MHTAEDRDNFGTGVFPTPDPVISSAIQQRYPRAAKYPLSWMLANEMGPNVIWLAEELSQYLPLTPGMQILDLGCGRAASSIFFAKEFGVQVWANDLWIKPGDNLARIREAGLADRIFPVHAEAHALPYAPEFFDAILALDSYHYFGTDDLYLAYLARFLKPGGWLGIVVPGLVQDFDEPPEHLTRRQASGAVFWQDDCWSFHTPTWWRRHWSHHSGLNVVHCELIPDGWRHWLEWEELRNGRGHTGFPSEAEALRADAGQTIDFVCAVARKPAPSGV